MAAVSRSVLPSKRLPLAYAPNRPTPKTALQDARGVAANTKVESNEDRNDLLVLTKYGGMTEKGAQLFNGLFSILAVSLFISFGSMRAELDDLRKVGPRQKLHLIARFRHWLASVWDPENATFQPKSEVHNHVTITDESAAEKLRTFAREMRDAINVPRAAAAAAASVGATREGL